MGASFADLHNLNRNILRDPRFGRASEDPSECPYLAGHYASEWLQGSQQKDPRGKYPLMITMLKHFAVYSQEHNRGGDDSCRLPVFSLLVVCLRSPKITIGD